MKHKREFPGSSAYTDVRGKRRWRYRKKGKTYSLGTDYGSEEFVRRYEAARKDETIDRQHTTPGTFSALCEAYYRSPKFIRLGQSTRTTYRGIIERFRETRGDKLVKDLRRRDVLAIMAKMSDKPAAANNLLRMLRMLMKLAMQLEWLETDPTDGVDKFPAGPGFHTWSEPEIARFYSVHKPGSVAHTAMTVILCTGAARSDAVKLGWANISEGRIHYQRQKMLTRDGMLVSIPILPELEAILRTLPKGTSTFLQTRYGRARSPKAFGNAMRKWCDEAGLPECTTHGLRKAIARRLAEAGCKPHEIAAITGHKDLKEVARYTEAADRELLADRGFERLTGTDRDQVVANTPAMLAK